MSLIRTAGAVLAAVLVSLALPTAAQELRIGLKNEPSSLDPQYQNIAANNQIALQMFDPLIARDDKQRLVPALALSWKAVSDTVWEFKLRPNVIFQDGSPFTAEDAVFTFERAARVPNSPSPFTSLTRQMTRLEIVDPLTLRITTGQPAPLLPFDLSSLPILSHRAAAGGAPEGKSTGELDRGEGLVGTGPFKFAAWRRGRELVLTRNETYWGARPAWSRVVFRPIGDASARLAALLASDLDLIEDPPSAEIARLKRQATLTLAEAVTGRLIYLGLDQFAEPSPGIPDTGGKNPLKDRRVRQALSQAIDRKGMVDKVMDGAAVPAGDFLPWPAFGAYKDAAPERFDPAGARQLLAQAGYPKGFAITLGAPNGRYTNDLKIAQWVAQSWGQVGVHAEVEAGAPAEFARRRDEFRYSAYLSGWGGDGGETSGPLRALVATPNREKGMGGSNRGRYSNPALDDKLDEALRTLDGKKREAALQEASRLALSDFAILPLQFEMAVWVMRRGIAYSGRADQATFAAFVTAAK
jgi:peptide/nickel transport system substrate-binding protein